MLLSVWYLLAPVGLLLPLLLLTVLRLQTTMLQLLLAGLLDLRTIFRMLRLLSQLLVTFRGPFELGAGSWQTR